MSKLSSEMISLFDLPPEAETVITGTTTADVAKETIARLSENQQLKVAIAKLSFYVEMLSDSFAGQDKKVSGLKAHCDRVMAGETRFGCAHLEDHKGSFWKFIAVAFTTPILLFVVLEVLKWAFERR